MNRLLRRKRLLFSDKYGWQKNICSELNSWRYQAYFNSFSEAELNEFDILVPQHLTDIVFMIKHHPELHGKKCFIPSLAALNTCNDKMLFNQFMVDNGFGDMIPKIDGILSFPYILKKRIDEFGSRSRIIENSKEEEVFQKFIDSDDYYSQEYVSGHDEFTTHILMVNGKCVFHKTLQFTFEQKLFVKGVGCKAPKGMIVSCPFINTFTSILNHLEFEGLCCFNYKLVDGQAKVFELNPRYGGSLTRFLSEMMKVYSKLLENH